MNSNGNNTLPKVVNDRYKIDKLIGRGGMSIVYKATDNLMQRNVALKLLRFDMLHESKFKMRFYREAKSYAKLNHRRIISVYDIDECMLYNSQVPFLIMEYIDGATLKSLLSKNKELITVKYTLYIIMQILEALVYSHKNFIIHRDIKPGNIILTDATNSQIKVMDFGVARPLLNSTMTITNTTAIIGTAHYLSPEQAIGKTVDARSDLYSVGCLFYEMLTGSPPFVGDSQLTVAYKHVSDIPIKVSKLNQSINKNIEYVVMKSLNKNPNDRFRSASQMLHIVNDIYSKLYKVNFDSVTKLWFYINGGNNNEVSEHETTVADASFNKLNLETVNSINSITSNNKVKYNGKNNSIDNVYIIIICCIAVIVFIVALYLLGER